MALSCQHAQQYSHHFTGFRDESVQMFFTTNFPTPVKRFISQLFFNVKKAVESIVLKTKMKRTKKRLLSLFEL